MSTSASAATTAAARPVPPDGAVPVPLDATHADVTSPAEVAAQIPEPSTLPPGAAVVLGPLATRKRGALGRLLGDGKTKVPLSARCTALLARGYVELGADGEVAWGFTPR